MTPALRVQTALATLVLAGLIAATGLFGTGCTVVPSTPDNGDMDTNGTPQPTPGPSVAIRFANLTDLAVLADVYVSTNGADLSPDALFVSDNLLMDGVGLASTGVLVPQSTDSVEVPCVDGMVVATTGGVFRDPDTGEELGTGNQRILQQGLVFDCEAEITFVYRLEGDVYEVVVTLN
ncbi:MAG: hypothetical protein H6816_07405 [Phycisphaerales bacterium]|nr:hypothetical protein [Phycisphaerales bacterium]